jgi:hypothetical protein
MGPSPPCRDLDEFAHHVLAVAVKADISQVGACVLHSAWGDGSAVAEAGERPVGAVDELAEREPLISRHHVVEFDLGACGSEVTAQQLARRSTGSPYVRLEWGGGHQSASIPPEDRVAGQVPMPACQHRSPVPAGGSWERSAGPPTPWWCRVGGYSRRQESLQSALAPWWLGVAWKQQLHVYTREWDRCRLLL